MVSWISRHSPGWRTWSNIPIICGEWCSFGVIWTGPLMVIYRKRVGCSLQVKEQTLPLTEKYKYLEIYLQVMNKRARDWKTIQISSSVTVTIPESVVVKQISLQTKFLSVNPLHSFCGFQGQGIKTQPRLERCPVCGARSYVGLLFAKLSVYQSILTQSHELWVVTESIRSPGQAVQLRSHHRVAELTLHDRVRSLMIW